MAKSNKRIPIMGSLPMTISFDELLKVGKGALIAVLAAIVVGLTNWVGSLDLSTIQGIVWMAITSVVINFLQKFLRDTSAYS